MKKYLLILIVFISISCKGKKEESTFEKTINIVNSEKNIEKKENILNINCLQKNDTTLIVNFEDKLRRALKENNKELIGIYINFPFKSEGVTYTEEEFFVSYLDILRNYYFKENIDIEEVHDLKRESYFAEKKDSDNCFIYIISNDFPSFEFNVRFYLEKINNEVKIVEILMAG